MYAEIKTNSVFISISPTTKHRQLLSHSGKEIRFKIINDTPKVPYASHFIVEEEWLAVSLNERSERCIIRNAVVAKF